MRAHDSVRLASRCIARVMQGKPPRIPDRPLASELVSGMKASRATEVTA